MNKIIVVAGLFFSLLVTQSFAADVEAGKAKVAETCGACHGMDGNSVSHDFPRLAGQNADYIRSALRAYQTGARKNPIMMGMAQPLSKDDIENVAAYFATQEGLFVKVFD